MNKKIVPLLAFALNSQIAPAWADAGKGHISVSGAESVNADYSITQCMVRRPGRALINGLGIVFAGDAKLDGAAVNVIGYSHDGVYPFAGRPGFIIGAPVTLNFKSHTSMVETSRSHTTVTVTRGGASGSATFSNWENMVTHKNISGKITWNCTEVKRPAF